MKRITGRLTEKNGKWYAVINLYDVNGKRKEKWQSLDLEAKRGSKTEATYRLGEILSKYNCGDLYLQESLRFDNLPQGYTYKYYVVVLNDTEQYNACKVIYRN